MEPKGMKPIGVFTVAIFTAQEGKGRPTAIVYQESEGADGVAAIRDFAAAYCSAQGSCVIVNAKTGIVSESNGRNGEREACGRAECIGERGHGGTHTDQSGNVIETAIEKVARQREPSRLTPS